MGSGCPSKLSHLEVLYSADWVGNQFLVSLGRKKQQQNTSLLFATYRAVILYFSNIKDRKKNFLFCVLKLTWPFVKKHSILYSQVSKIRKMSKTFVSVTWIDVRWDQIVMRADINSCSVLTSLIRNVISSLWKVSWNFSGFYSLSFLCQPNLSDLRRGNVSEK